MPTHRTGIPARPGLSLILLCLFLGILCVAGGASRPEVSGQLVVRCAGWGAAIFAILFVRRLQIPGKAVPALLAAAILLVLAQLVPLPVTVWQALPGRAMLAEAAAASGQAQPWRPWSIVPGATINAASSLIVPFTTLLLMAGLRPAERRWLPGLILLLVVAETIVSLLQFSGASLGNPFVNATDGQVSGTFANRNHLALFVAMGCLLAPVWAFASGRSSWRNPVACGLVLLFVVVIVAIGSRAGLGLGIVALGLGLAAVGGDVRRAVGRAPRWALFALPVLAIGVTGSAILVGIASDRAETIVRALEPASGADMRGRGLPTVIGMIRTYFPAGSGFGTFDPAFRIHEPFALLKPTYFNHAHNEFLEVASDAGVPGLLLLAAAIAWWAVAGLRAWRGGPAMRHARAGAGLLLLVLLAGAFDYPARTPLIMATVVIAAFMLDEKGLVRNRSTLPDSGRTI